MRAADFLSHRKLRTYLVRLRISNQKGRKDLLNTTVQARNAEQARRIIRTQYNDPNIMVGQPKLIAPR